MTTKELIEKIDGETKGEIIEQAYDLGFTDGYNTNEDKWFDNVLPPRELDVILQFRDGSYAIGFNSNVEGCFYVGGKLYEYENIIAWHAIPKQNNKTEHKIDNKPNPPMPKDYGELKIISHPKHIVVNGALYEKIDDAVMVITDM